MQGPPSRPVPRAVAMPGSRRVISILGIGQIVAWGSSYYLLAVLAEPIARDTGWKLTWVVGGISLGLLAAGGVSPWIGRSIERRGGRPVLAASSVLLAAGLALLAVSHSLFVYFAAWLVIGLGMGAGLYDPAFATLGRLYGDNARTAITTLTLFGGFASTVCWPLSAFLVLHAGWRGACFAYAASHLLVLLPLYLLALPREAARPLQARPFASSSTTDGSASDPNSKRLLFGLLALVITLSAMISTLVSVHLLTILQTRGVTLAAAVGLGALVGPSQVGARLIELIIARYHHPIWTKLVATSLVTVGIGALWVRVPFLAAPLVFYGAGIGLESIARGTLPLALFAGAGYAELMGRLALPSLIAQAAAPSIGAALLYSYGASGTLAVLACVAAVNFLFVLALFMKLTRATNALPGWQKS